MTDDFLFEFHVLKFLSWFLFMQVCHAVAIATRTKFRPLDNQKTPLATHMTAIRQRSLIDRSLRLKY